MDNIVTDMMTSKAARLPLFPLAYHFVGLWGVFLAKEKERRSQKKSGKEEKENMDIQ